MKYSYTLMATLCIGAPLYGAAESWRRLSEEEIGRQFALICETRYVAVTLFPEIDTLVMQHAEIILPNATYEGIPAIHIALKYMCGAAALTLAQRGADLEAKYYGKTFWAAPDAEGKTVLELTLPGYSADFLKQLLNAGAQVTPKALKIAFELDKNSGRLARYGSMAELLWPYINQPTDQKPTE